MPTPPLEPAGGGTRTGGPAAFDRFAGRARGAPPALIDLDDDDNEDDASAPAPPTTRAARAASISTPACMSTLAPLEQLADKHELEQQRLASKMTASIVGDLASESGEVRGEVC